MSTSMPKTAHAGRRPHPIRLEALESRNLMSLLINAQPTLEVVPNGNRVHATRGGAISIVQPVPITVTGTAQPASSTVAVQVQIYAKDANGNLVNGGAPLATATPDVAGQYTATLSLPSRLRKDVNTLFAREVAVGTLTSTIQIAPTTVTGLTGTTTTAAGTGTIGGTVVTPSTPITGIGGTITTPAFPIATAGGNGVAGPAVGTLLGGTGTLDPTTGTIVGGTVAIDPGTGTFTQVGSATVAGTTGTSTMPVQEVAVSQPITVLIHQSQAIPGVTLATRAKLLAAKAAHAATPVGSQALAVQATKAHAKAGRS